LGGTNTRGLGAGLSGSGELARAGLSWIGGCAAVVSLARRSEESVALPLDQVKEEINCPANHCVPHVETDVDVLMLGLVFERLRQIIHTVS
jgi:hypothetical protein